MRTGEKYGRLTVLELFKKGKNQYAKCLCECGSITSVRADGLKSGHTKSCGCYKRDVQRARMIERNTTHGQSKTRLYNTYYGMRERCYDKNFKMYKHYGGRGITICDEWLNDFLAFKKWADSSGYADNLTIDRVDGNGNYEPSNCRWIPQSEQIKNTRNSRKITFNGETKCLSEWARCTGIKRKTISNRIDRLGWSVEEALTKEVAKYERTR